MSKTEFTLLDMQHLHGLTADLEAAGVLYYALGGNRSHTVIAHQWRHAGYYSDETTMELDCCELLADIWEYQVGGKDYFSTPASQMQVYFLKNKLPGDKQVCRAGFPLIADDLVMHVENPTQIISTAANDGSELASLVQYLMRPSAHRTEYGALADRVDLLLDAWQAKKQKDAVC